MKKNKKGVMWSDIKDAVIAAMVIGVLLYIVWAYVLHGGVKNVDTLSRCNALTGNDGQCKRSCDPTLEIGYQISCKGKGEICCVRKNPNMQDVILPGGYGGELGVLDFTVKSINFADNINIPGCRLDNTDALEKTLICQPGKRYTIPIEIGVQNVRDAVKVYADPIAVINGNGDTITNFGRFDGPSVTLSEVINTRTESNTVEGEVITTNQNNAILTPVYTNINIDSSESKENMYWEVYPYVRCDTRDCKNTDKPANKGILSFNDKEFLIISFEESLI